MLPDLLASAHVQCCDRTMVSQHVVEVTAGDDAGADTGTMMRSSWITGVPVGMPWLPEACPLATQLAEAALIE